jgi:hypothetical protein
VVQHTSRNFVLLFNTVCSALHKNYSGHSYIVEVALKAGISLSLAENTESLRGEDGSVSDVCTMYKSNACRLVRFP